MITKFSAQIKELGPIGEAEGLSKEELKVRIAFGNATKAVRKDAVWSNGHIGGIVNEKMERSLTTALGCLLRQNPGPRGSE